VKGFLYFSLSLHNKNNNNNNLTADALKEKKTICFLNEVNDDKLKRREENGNMIRGNNKEYELKCPSFDFH
jgi:hypothetical protein